MCGTFCICRLVKLTSRVVFERIHDGNSECLFLIILWLILLGLKFWRISNLFRYVSISGAIWIIVCSGMPLPLKRMESIQELVFWHVADFTPAESMLHEQRFVIVSARHYKM
jgi:hypothetical protein